MDGLLWSVRRNPGEICLTDHRFNQFILADHVRKLYSCSNLTHSFILRKEEAPVCVACNAVLTVKHILIECADLLEIRKKYFDEKSLYSLFRNVIPEVVFDFLREIGVFYKV